MQEKVSDEASKAEEPNYVPSELEERFSLTGALSEASYGESNPIFEACVNGQVAVCEELLRAGKFSEIDAVHARTGFTLLSVACDRGDFAMVSMLLNNKASVTCCCKDSQNTPLHYAALRGRLDICKLLVTHDSSSVNVMSSNGFMPLHVASFKGYLDICRLFMNIGADPRKKSKDGWQAWECAKDPAVACFVRLFSRNSEEERSKHAHSQTRRRSASVAEAEPQRGQQRSERVHRHRSMSVMSGFGKRNK